jgi:hypothetical protein
MGWNLVSHFPKAICELKKINYINIGGENVKIPFEILKLQNLEILIVNFLKYQLIYDLQNLKYFGIYNNKYILNFVNNTESKKLIFRLFFIINKSFTKKVFCNYKILLNILKYK